MDAWELLAAGSTLSTGDAWERLNALGSTEPIPGGDKLIQCETATLSILGGAVSVTQTGITEKVGGDDVPRVEIWEYRKKKPIDEVVDEVVAKTEQPVEQEPVAEQIEPALAEMESIKQFTDELSDLERERVAVAVEVEMQRIRRLQQDDAEILMLLLL